MKKLLLILSIVLLLTGCGKNKEITGEVASVSAHGDFIELTILGKDVSILADSETYVYSFSDEIPHEKLLTGELRSPVITAYELKWKNGDWLADRICVESYILPEPYVLQDGTELNIRKSYRGTSYETLNGWELLWEQAPVGPDNVLVGDLPSLTDLKPAVQEKITAYYDELGLLYDLDAELEKAHQNFLSLDNPTGFQPYHLAQDIVPTAANDRLIWYAVIVTEPVGNGQVQEHRMGTVFDRETGDVIDAADLFTCTEEELGKQIMDIVNLPDAELKQEMENAFRFDYLNFHSNALDICFPAGSLPSQDAAHLLGVEYKDLSDILYPWAIPDSDE